MAEGWIKLYRKTQDNFLWTEKPFDKARAWIDLLLMAMHQEKKMIIDGSKTTVLRGSFVTSRLKLADRWGWSVKKVDAYLKLLESEKMVTTKGTTKGTTVTIVKYEEYQVMGTTEDIAKVTTEVISEVTTEDTQNKNDKKEKNENKSNVEIDVFFEKIWKRYKVKQGKASVSKSQKTKLYKYGLEQIMRCIDRYEAEMKRIGRDIKYWKNGSTFFNTGFVDYLDSNYNTADESNEKPNEYLKNHNPTEIEDDDSEGMNFWDEDEVKGDV